MIKRSLHRIPTVHGPTDRGQSGTIDDVINLVSILCPEKWLFLAQNARFLQRFQLLSEQILLKGNEAVHITDIILLTSFIH